MGDMSEQDECLEESPGRRSGRSPAGGAGPGPSSATSARQCSRSQNASPVLELSSADSAVPSFSGVPKRLFAGKRLAAKTECTKRTSNVKFFSVYIDCNPESESTLWSCDAVVEFRLLSQRPDIPHFSRQFTNKFNFNSNNWGFPSFMEWGDILNAEKGYVKGDRVVVEARITVQKVIGVSSGLIRMAKRRRRNDRLQRGGRPEGTRDKCENPTSLEHPSTDSLSQPKASSAAAADDDDIEVVVDSQESVGSSQYAENSDDSIIILEDDEWKDCNYNKRMDFKLKAKEICSLYAQFSGKDWEYPLQSECPFRDEQNLLDQRMKSFNQMKALCLRLEACIKENLPAEKYLSFDDTTQRDALEIMGIRYEELSDDIFGVRVDHPLEFARESFSKNPGDETFQCDDDYISFFDDDEIRSDYAEMCMQSKLTEVGLRYVNKVYKVIRQINATVTEYRAKTSQCVENLRAVDLKISKIREEFGNLSPLVAEAIDSNRLWNAGPSIKKDALTGVYVEHC
ncbi:unnamed protein product [Angiostrongylus costaricensis]|uniref:MATH domain-containing protein n=1 Tax=Angiostrongylus costaricensis TaxID=334426 RepID=A0A0R3PJR2_ANGCS|nr:unnamed protein product [Angiostrongylus costaricensis]